MSDASDDMALVTLNHCLVTLSFCLVSFSSLLLALNYLSVNKCITLLPFILTLFCSSHSVLIHEFFTECTLDTILSQLCKMVNIKPLAL
jgi:hypothetical protein